MKNRIVAVLFVIVFVLLIAVVFSLLNDSSSTADISSFRIQSQQTEGGGIVSSIETPPATTAPQVTWLPNPTQAPAPAAVPATPVPTAAPTPVPTPTPAPVNTVIGSGTFESNSGTYLNITADWTATAVSDSRVDVTVKVNAKSYALDYHGFPNAVHIAIGDKYESCEANTVSYIYNDLTLNELATHTVSIDLPAGSSNTYTMQVVWDFNGVYGSPSMGPVPITSLECGGTINLSR